MSLSQWSRQTMNDRRCHRPDCARVRTVAAGMSEFIYRHQYDWDSPPAKHASTMKTVRYDAAIALYGRMASSVDSRYQRGSIYRSLSLHYFMSLLVQFRYEVPSLYTCVTHSYSKSLVQYVSKCSQLRTWNWRAEDYLTGLSSPVHKISSVGCTF